jgi:sRNA-binding protein
MKRNRTGEDMSEESHKRYRQRRQLRLQAETLRGMQESREAIATLQSLWPATFPEKIRCVRPLATGIIAAIAERTGWSRSYARGVVHVWKARDAYCEAVLRYDRRFDLNGDPVEQTISEESREQARWRLAARGVRLRRRQQQPGRRHLELSAGVLSGGENSSTTQAVLAS